jgi:hypothetical protein
MPPLDLGRLGPEHWLADAAEPIQHPAYLVFAVILTLAMAGAVYVKIMASQMFDGNRFKQREAAKLANVVLGFGLVGLVILLFRWQPVPFLSKRIWFYLWWLSALATTGYFIHYYRTDYPGRLYNYSEEARRRRYLPRAGATVRMRRRSRRRR